MGCAPRDLGKDSFNSRLHNRLCQSRHSSSQLHTRFAACRLASSPSGLFTASTPTGQHEDSILPGIPNILSGFTLDGHQVCPRAIHGLQGAPACDVTRIEEPHHQALDYRLFIGSSMADTERGLQFASDHISMRKPPVHERHLEFDGRMTESRTSFSHQCQSRVFDALHSPNRVSSPGRTHPVGHSVFGARQPVRLGCKVSNVPCGVYGRAPEVQLTNLISPQMNRCDASSRGSQACSGFSAVFGINRGELRPDREQAEPAPPKLR